MQENKDLVGKRFKEIEDDMYGGFSIKFLDGTIAHFGVSTYPDGTVSEVYRESNYSD